MDLNRVKDSYEHGIIIKLEDEKRDIFELHEIKYK